MQNESRFSLKVTTAGKSSSPDPKDKKNEKGSEEKKSPIAAAYDQDNRNLLTKKIR